MVSVNDGQLIRESELYSGDAGRREDKPEVAHPLAEEVFTFFV